MRSFKDYSETQTMLEAVFKDLEDSLKSNASIKKWSELPPTSRMKPYMLLQTYIAALIVGVSSEDIETNPMLMLRPPYKDAITNLFMNSDFKDDYRIEFYEKLPEDQLLNIESPQVQRGIHNLTNEYGDKFHIKEPVSESSPMLERLSPVERMKKIVKNIGVEFEFPLNVPEFVGVKGRGSLENLKPIVAKDIQPIVDDLFPGYKVVASSSDTNDKTTTTHSTGISREFTLTTDSSVSQYTTDSEGKSKVVVQGMEIISPRLAFTADTVENLAVLFKDIITETKYTSKPDQNKAGLHVHIGIFQGMTFNHILRLSQFFANSEDVKSHAGRSENKYSQDEKTIISDLESVVSLETDSNEITKGLEGIINKLFEDRYRTVNYNSILKHNTVEIRIGSASLTNNTSRFVNYMNFINNGLHYAIEENFIELGDKKLQIREDGSWVIKMADGKVNKSKTPININIKTPILGKKK